MNKVLTDGVKRKIAIGIAIAAICTAIGIVLYPLICSSYNAAHQSQIRVQHKAEIAQVADERVVRIRKAAEEYNRTLQPISDREYTSEMLQDASENYGSQLDLVGDGIMGYVDIPVINTHLPIYHGTNENTLEIGVGHLLGSSLPIGGTGTHSVLTAHSGMASQKMFSDLPQMEMGDVFYIQVLNEILAYKVDAIHTVSPHDTTHLQVESQRDYCTLVTCTPFGVNTHRLLVRGSRIPYEPDHEPTAAKEDRTEAKVTTSTWNQEYVKGILYGIGAVAVGFAGYGTYCLWRTHNGKA